jgi:hypothetical protein
MVRDLEDPRIRTLLELRKELDEEIERLRERVEKLEAYIQMLDASIGATSFATADTALGRLSEPARPTAKASAPVPSVPVEQPRSLLIMNKARDLELATIEIKDRDLRIVPAPHASYDIKRGAFARFFVERILGLFQQEDRHRVENEEIEWDDSFDFEVRTEDGILQEVVVKNYGGETRLAEIERALRWALEKTYRAR